MSTRSFLVRGLLAGLLAGFLAFLVAHEVGEPHVEQAIALEATGHHHDVVSRADQRGWGLATGTVAVGTALGGLVALAAAGAMGRIGRLTPGQSTAVVALIGFVSFALVPFLKYPANPPAVGSGDTIGSRTALYFGFLLVSVLAAVAATVLAQRVWSRSGAYAAVVGGTGAYLAVMALAAVLMPAVDELGAFPAATLWSFRVSSLLTLATLWAAVGVLLTGFVVRLHRQHGLVVARRELAASL